jgi:hypothetical protein
MRKNIMLHTTYDGDFDAQPLKLLLDYKFSADISRPRAVFV